MHNNVYKDGMIQIESAERIYRRYKGHVLWYIMDLWDNKFTRWHLGKTESESEKVHLFQSLQALKRILKERGEWDEKSRRPVDPFSKTMSGKRYGWQD